MFIKSILSILTILPLITLSSSQLYICSEFKACKLYGNSTLIVIASINVPSLTIVCPSKNSCKREGINPGLKVYSSANITTIKCEGEDSCEETECNFGIKPKKGLLPITNKLRFLGKPRKIANVYCNGKQSCKSIRINSKGKLSKGLNLFTGNNEDNKGGLIDGKIECGKPTVCKIDCTDNVMDSCKSLKCFGICKCIGNECPNDLSIRETTEKPEENENLPLLPTARPTEEPVTQKNITECDKHGCMLKPGNNFDVVCGEEFNLCIVECLMENQCQNNVVVFANSKKVIIKCLEHNSCDKMIIANVKHSNIDVEIMGMKSAEKMEISILNPKSVLKVKVDGKEAFYGGMIICDGKCSLVCMGEDGCKEAKYDCLTSSKKCALSCQGDNCPEVNKYGDPTCDKKVCYVEPNGDDRIVVTSKTDKVIIDCTKEDQQCKAANGGLKIYSGAKSTQIICKNHDACTGVEVCVGDLKGVRLPKGFKESDFIVQLNKSINEKQKLEMDCSAHSACKELELFVGTDVDAHIIASGESALEEASLECEDCAALKYECEDYTGCTGSVAYCMPEYRCECVQVPLDYKLNDTMMTGEPNTCPFSMQPMRKSIYANNNNNNYNNKNDNLYRNALIIVSILGVIVMFIAGFIVLSYRKSFKNIQLKNEKFIKQGNNYDACNIEMH